MIYLIEKQTNPEFSGNSPCEGLLYPMEMRSTQGEPALPGWLYHGRYPLSSEVECSG